MTDDERIWRASEAERLLAEPLLVEAFAGVEAETVEQLKRLPIWSDDEQRRALCHRLTLLENVKQHLSAVIAAGKYAVQRRDADDGTSP